MARRSESTITAEAYTHLPNDEHLDELVRGRIVRQSRPRARHGRVAATITIALGRWAQRTGAGVVYVCDTGFVLARNPDTVRGPDVAYVTRARVPYNDNLYIEGAPDLAVEVLSPGNRPAAMREKVDDYLAAGASAVWVVDTDRKTLSVYQGGDRRVLGAQDTVAMPGLLPDFALSVQKIFA